MAQSGTITKVHNVYRNAILVIAGVTNATNCPPFISDGFPYGTIQVTTTGTTPTGVQLQGSNDGTNWSNLGAAASSFPAMAPLTVAGESPALWYQFTVSGGDGTTVANAVVLLTGSK